MKKIFLLFALVAFAACASGVSSPGTAAKQYVQYVADGQYDKFADGIAVPADTSPEEAAQGKEMWAGLMKEKGAKTIEEKGGIKAIEVLSEQIAEDGQTATVELRITYGNGTTDDDEMEMRLDGSKWKMEMSK